jgi:hypothetical protein
VSSRRLLSVTLALLMTAAPAAAQSLGELARQEEARRITSPKASRIYSNASLEPGEVTSPAPETSTTASCYMSKREGRCVTPEALLVNTAANLEDAEKAKQKPMWQQEAAGIRDEVKRLRHEWDRLSLTVASDRSAAERDAAKQKLSALQPLLDHQQQRWSKLEKKLTDFNYPRSWIEPAPDFAGPSPQ